MMAACTKNGKVALPFYSDADPISSWHRATEGRAEDASAAATPEQAAARAPSVGKPDTKANKPAADNDSKGEAALKPSKAKTGAAAESKPSASKPSASKPSASKPSAASANTNVTNADKARVSSTQPSLGNRPLTTALRQPSLGQSAEYHRYKNVTVKPRLRGQVETEHTEHTEHAEHAALSTLSS